MMRVSQNSLAAAATTATDESLQSEWKRRGKEAKTEERRQMNGHLPPLLGVDTFGRRACATVKK